MYTNLTGQYLLSTTAEEVDLTIPTLLEVTFTPGSPLSNNAIFIPTPAGIQTLDDDSVEGDHSFQVILSSVQAEFSGVVTLDTTPSTVTIFDNDGEYENN